MTDDKMIGQHPDSMHMSLSKLWELVMDREAWCVCCSSWGLKESDMIEQQD